jgi:mono/diheme cytochrome c family protein
VNSNFATCLRFLVTLFLATVLIAADSDSPKPHPLVWDSIEKTLEVKPDGHEARFEFSVTNKSAEPVEILHIEPSCGCTVAELPSNPWVLAPGANGSFSAVVDYRGKHGKFSKTLNVQSSAGSQLLTVIINVPDTEESRRARNQQLAIADRQAVFRGECASCHVGPTAGKVGAELYTAACAICHGANNRASMVPDLMIAREERNAAYWEKWISDGKERTLMPAFAAKHFGPLSDEQIASLVEYAMTHFPRQPSN